MLQWAYTLGTDTSRNLTFTLYHLGAKYPSPKRVNLFNYGRNIQTPKEKRLHTQILRSRQHLKIKGTKSKNPDRFAHTHTHTYVFHHFPAICKTQRSTLTPEPPDPRPRNQPSCCIFAYALEPETISMRRLWRAWGDLCHHYIATV